MILLCSSTFATSARQHNLMLPTKVYVGTVFLSIDAELIADALCNKAFVALSKSCRLPLPRISVLLAI